MKNTDKNSGVINPLDLKTGPGISVALDKDNNLCVGAAPGYKVVKKYDEIEKFERLLEDDNYPRSVKGRPKFNKLQGGVEKLYNKEYAIKESLVDLPKGYKRNSTEKEIKERVNYKYTDESLVRDIEKLLNFHFVNNEGKPIHTITTGGRGQYGIKLKFSDFEG